MAIKMPNSSKLIPSKITHYTVCTCTVHVDIVLLLNIILLFFYSELTQFIPIEIDSIQLSQSGSMASISSYTKGGTAGTPAGKYRL